MGVGEVPPGSNTGPHIREYFSGCLRGAKPLRITSGPWCAAAACWAGYVPWEDDLDVDPQAVPPPHLWRASVAELIDDARAVGAWHPMGDDYAPRHGDLAIFARNGHDPTHGGLGHVGRVESSTVDTLTTIDGNHGDAWARVTRPMHEALGFIAYPVGA